MEPTSTNAQFICPLWGTPAELIADRGLYQIINSTRAGGFYRIASSVLDTLKSRNEKLSAKLTTWLFNERKNGIHDPILTTYIIDEVKNKNPITFSQKIKNFFEYLNSHSLTFDFHFRISQPNHPSKINDDLSVCIEATDTIGVQLRDFLRTIKKAQYISLDMMEETIYIEPKGWEFLEKITQVHHSSDKAFVAMWFDKELTVVYEKEIELALEDCGYARPFRIDRVEHINKIDDEIIARINHASLMVVDLTCRDIDYQNDKSEMEKIAEARGGVYFEAGYAMGLNIPIVWTCRKDSVDHVHFDTRQYNQIIWYQEGDKYWVGENSDRISLRKALVNRITAIRKNRNVN